MTKIAAWSSLLSLLGVGVMIGGLAVHIHHGGSRADGARRPHVADGERPHRRGPFIDHLAEELELSDEQRVEIRSLMAEAREEGAKLRREMRPKLIAQLESTHERILAVLDEEQRSRFEALAPDPEQLARDLYRGPPGGERPRGRRPRGKHP